MILGNAVVRLLLLYSANFKPTNATFPSTRDLKPNFYINSVLSTNI